MIRAMPMYWGSLMRSPNIKYPIMPMATVPTPDQIAYAMLMGQYCSVTVNSEKEPK
jgi:hypothetical protein